MAKWLWTAGAALVLLGLLAHVFGWENTPPGWTQLLTYTAISIALASISWFAFEAPINGLKRYFEYDKTARTRPATSN